MGSLETLVEQLRGANDLIDEARGGQADEQAARELELYMDNDREVYGWKHRDYYKNLTQKLAAGRYDRSQAVKLFMYLVERAAKKYIKEHGSRGQSMSSMFSKPTRELVATALRDEFEDYVRESPEDLEQYVPKKYRGKKLSL